MRVRIMSAVATLALVSSVIVAPQLSEAAGAPKMGGDFTDVVPIPVNDPTVKEIAGALFKPDGAGPFPVVVYMPPCGGPQFPPELQQEKIWIERFKSQGVATLIVDPFMPRGLENGVCDKVLTIREDVQNKKEDVLAMLGQSSDDAVSAVKAVKAMPGIDPKKVFLMGLSYGGTSTLSASDPNSARPHDTDIAGAIAYFPLCSDKAEAAVPTLIMIGDKDDWTGPVAACEALKGKGKFDVVIYPGATHAFTMPFDKPIEYAGHKMAHDEAATQDAAQRVAAFIEAQLK